jgi:chromosome segregation ATPase
MSTEQKQDLILQNVTDIKTDIKEIKSDIKTVFEKVNHEHDTNIKQDMRLQEIEKDNENMEKRINDHIKADEQKKEDDIKNKVKLAIVWTILGFIGTVGGAIIITNIIKSILGGS